jgi:hypothetical protein
LPRQNAAVFYRAKSEKEQSVWQNADTKKQRTFCALMSLFGEQ